MEITHIFSLLGGLALFLYGMNVMSNGLEVAAGNRLKAILERLTANRLVGVGVGALVTALVQSSSATTVMVVGFVNSGLMTLNNAVWLIMGANIGTTITGQLIAININAIAPLIAFIGVSLISFFKSQKLDPYGRILVGLGILFIGMDIMSTAVSPLREMPEFVNLITRFQNPILGILAGAIFSAILQSSSASIGILQAFAASGVITLPSAIFILFGQNIGTVITALIASIGVSKNGKRTTLLHLLFNFVGSIIFVTLALTTPFTSWMENFTPDNVQAQIANVHTVFNVVTAFILLPFGSQLVDLTYKLLPDRTDEQTGMQLKYLDFSLFGNDYRIGTSAVTTMQLFKETQNMLDQLIMNVQATFDLVGNYSDDAFTKIEETEEYIDFLNDGIIRFTTTTLSFEAPESGTSALGLFVKISSDLERIGDHAINIAERARVIHRSGDSLSDEALEELQAMKKLARKIMALLQVRDRSEIQDLVSHVNIIEDQMDFATEEFENNQLLRLQDQECTVNNSILFSKILTDFERMGDLSLNVAKNFESIQSTIQSLRNLQESE
ncbi:Na/Pi-cotransporter [Dolosigranulum pigrum]|uniref:Na/Pi cotransporter family protein n=1 Tax=Dolosigranulum pigrum TaxID=29394 RepID=UPI000DC26961|nr:Na/Pi cotransporter family protein [Dolosigranulum pigrum]RAN57440.1 Na/Pi-cotransporter [Dolosigranulum pigrum]